jgi:proteasome lid subunit RPN8/RPN11
VIVLGARADAAIRTHATEAYPDECCGAIVGLAEGAGRVVLEAWPLVNSAANPSRHFEVSASEYQRVEARATGARVTLLGFYHSHPDAPAAPSAHDLAQAWPNVDYIIVSVMAGTPERITGWRLRDDRSAFESEDITWPTKS